MDNTTATFNDTKVNIFLAGVPVFGIPGYKFDLIHGLAIVSLGISIIVSTCVVIYLHWDRVVIFKKTIGERLTIYLAVCDLLYSISHMPDHSYRIVGRGQPPDTLCIIMAYFLSEFILAQSLLVSFTAINAFLLVVKERKISLGRFDWKLLVGAFVVPAAALVPCAAFGIIGSAGPWCFVDMSKETGPLVTTIISAGMTATFLANLICYMLVWGKIQQVTKATSEIGSSTSQGAKYAGTAKVLMLFVAAYIAQWCTYVMYSVWAIFQDPPIVLFCIVEFLCNLGGVFNFIAYTYVRIMLKQKAAEEKATLTLKVS